MASAKEFIEAYSPYALYVQEKYGIPYGLVLAQAALESGWGESSLAEKALNFFGIKAGSSWEGETVIMPTTEVIGGKSVKIPGVFRAYDDPLASFSDYGRLLSSNPRYASVLAADDPYEAAEALERAGYATDPQYAEKLSDIIRRYDLDEPPKKTLWNKLTDPFTSAFRKMITGEDGKAWRDDILKDYEEYKKTRPNATLEEFYEERTQESLREMNPAYWAHQIWNDVKTQAPRVFVIVVASLFLLVMMAILLRGGKAYA